MSNKVYVGKANDYKSRLRRHRTNLINNVHANVHLQSAVNKYGINYFDFSLLEEHGEEFLSSMENYWCNLLHAHDRNYGYNMLSTSPHSGGRIPQESKDKISKALKGVPKSKSHKQSIGMSTSKKVYQYSKTLEFIKEWDSRSIASQSLSIKVENISGCANGRRTSAGGFIWKNTKV